MQVFAVGRCVMFSERWMHIRGFMAPNPRVGGREQDVMYSKNRDFYSGVKSARTAHKSVMVWLFSW